VAVGGFTRGRRWLGAAEGLGTALAVIFVVAVISYAATRPTLRRRLDLTEGAQYTLSEQTRQVLGSLEEPVTLVALLQPEFTRVPNGLSEVQARAIEYVVNLLREYEIASDGQVTVRRLSPSRDRLEAEELSREFSLTRYNVVVVRGPERHRVVTLEDMVTIDRGYAQPPTIQPAELIDLHGEAPLTSALLDVAHKDAPRVGFLRGFGGPSTADTGDFGLFLFQEQVRGQGLQPEDVDLSVTPEVPEGLAALVVWGPELPIGARVRDALLAFHDRGGALLIGVDPLHEDPELEELLARLGVQREHALLCRDDTYAEGMRRSQLAITQFASEHPITAPIARQGTFAGLASVGGLARSREAAAGDSLVTLVAGPGEAFGDLPSGGGGPGDFTLGDGEVRGPRQLAVAVTGAGGRVVVFGTDSFLTAAFLRDEGGPANSDLGLNALSWLVQREESIAARPKPVYESRVDLTPDEQGRIVLYVIVLLPLGGVALGLLVWLARRR
jgi:ABC-type uncharacterized transport system